MSPPAAPVMEMMTSGGDSCHVFRSSLRGRDVRGSERVGACGAQTSG